VINPVLHVKPISALAARLSVISSLFFVIILGSLHFLEPEFDPTWRFISEYALGNFGWLMHLAFGLLAVSLISAGIVTLSQARNITGYIGLVILGLSAIGIIVAAIFATDPISVSPDDATFSGKIHSIGATLDYTPVAALLISFALARNEAWKVIQVRLFVTAGITIIIMALFILQIPHDGQFGPDVLVGLFGRILIVSYLGWILIVGTHALKLRRQNHKV